MPSTPFLFIFRNSDKDPRKYLEFKDLRDSYIKESKGEAFASIAAKEWLDDKETIKQVTVRKLASLDKMKPGKLYYFEYDPLTMEDLFDSLPLAICITDPRTKSNCEVGINLHFLPDVVMKNFVQDFLKFYSRQILAEIKSNPLNTEKQKELPIRYENLLKRFDKRYYFTFAVRNYLSNRAKNIYEISYENWYVASSIIPTGFKGFTVGNRDIFYLEYIKKKFKNSKK